ncbi:long-chain acyl-CoA synthetase [Microlunatus sagamiharensis]|uniref:Long-chain acyl-CoA synthetase n=1 Tax=Microlunatus sagamiharensis TaxID=546874 RepID=A0A1H2LPM5_9ACTN|nr:AMP-dependent synthetase/ligase [Microlunatus sagamiharensis]SDU82628.1 long-chain acyl-CoA synthetase [Microlunatus sagamiharensis]
MDLADHTDRAAEILASRPSSMGAMLLEQVAASGEREAFRHLQDGRWVSLTWSDTRDAVFEIAAGLLAVGVELEDRVAIASGTRIEWVLADLAIMSAGAATTTVYPTTQHEDVAFILGDSGARVVFAEDQSQVDKIEAHADELTDLETIVQISGTPRGGRTISLDELRSRGRQRLAEHPGCVEDVIARTGPDHLATLIYTSGTTGTPKGVRLVHDCLTYEGAAVEAYDIIYRDDLQYLWLPLSHVFGKALLAIQLRIGFASAVEGDIDSLVENLGVVQPTFMCGAPRIFEKVRARVMTSASSGPKKRIVSWAFSVGRRTSPLRLAGGRPKGLLAAQQALAERLVFSAIKARMGGKIRFFVSGSAGLNREVQEWFHAAGLLVLEGYGLTETSAATFVNNPRATRFGTVGPVMPGSEVKIADDGEVMIKGPGVMRGYHHLPEATEEAFVDGWFATGDLGELDDHGYLKITDRKKDLIKTSGGKYVAPSEVEGVIKAASPYVSQVVAHGEGRKYISALIALDPQAIAEWADGQGLSYGSTEDLTRAPEVRALIDGHVQAANRKLERWETVKRWAFLPGELDVENGEVTPSLKVRRAEVERRYRDLLDSLYDLD